MEKFIVYLGTDPQTNQECLVVVTPVERLMVVEIPAKFEIVKIKGDPEQPDHCEIAVVDATMRNETDEEFLARVAARAVPVATKYAVVDANKIPATDAEQLMWGKALPMPEKSIGVERWDELGRAEFDRRKQALNEEFERLSARADTMNREYLAIWKKRAAAVEQKKE